MTFNDFLLEAYNIESCTTFWLDFSIADKFGSRAVNDTYQRSKHWVKDVKMWTELCIVLNLRCSQHFEKNNFALSEMYGDLYHKACTLGYDTYQNRADDLQYFRNLID